VVPAARLASVVGGRVVEVGGSPRRPVADPSRQQPGGDEHATGREQVPGQCGRDAEVDGDAEDVGQAERQHGQLVVEAGEHPLEPGDAGDARRRRRGSHRRR
jgi:hypothetical protein